MIEVEVLSGQTLIDIAMQELGDASRLFELAQLNGLLPTDDVIAGSVLIVPAYETNRQNIVRQLQINKPSTGSTIVEQALLEGVDYWAVGIDFIVS